MKHSNGINSVVSHDYGNGTMHTQTPSLKLFPLRGRYAKSLMWGSLNVQRYQRPPSSEIPRK